MRKNAVILTLLILVASILLGYFKFMQNNKFLPTIEISKLRNGDLILRCGRSTESYAVILADKNAEFSHIGIISIENNEVFVIHAVPSKDQFIRKEKINIFLGQKNTSAYAIYRTHFSQKFLKNVVSEAQNFYDKKFTFDNEYDLNSNSKLYCTELVLKAFQNSGINLKIEPQLFNYGIGKHQIIFPSAFTKAPLFYKIY